MLNMLIVYDHPVVRKGLETYLNAKGFVRVSGTASNGLEALELLHGGLLCDVLVCDRRMPVMNGIELSRKVKISFPAIHVLILSLHDHSAYVREALEAGATALISKYAGLHDLDQALYAIDQFSGS